MTTDTRLSIRLDREWAHLCRRPAVVAQVRSWALTEMPFSSLEEFLELTGRDTESTPDTDALLGRLVGVARNEPLACRIVLQRILPGLLAIARTEQRRNAAVDAFDLVVGEAWLAISGYRIETRPAYVAARLLRDARHRAFTSHRRRRVVQEIACGDDALTSVPHEPRVAAFEELIGVLSEARRTGLPEVCLQTIGELVNHGSAANVASAKSVTKRAVRYRQRRSVAQIRRLVAA